MRSEEHGERLVKCPETQGENHQCLVGVVAEKSYSVVCLKSFGTELGQEARFVRQKVKKQARIGCSFKMTVKERGREMRQCHQGEEGVVWERSETRSLALPSGISRPAALASPTDLLKMQNFRPSSPE